MENFHLESNEELFSIIDRIKRSRDMNITLVIPSGLSALRSVINLKILKEEAISLGKNVSIFSSDVLIKKLAQQSGLVVLERPDEEKGWPQQLMEPAASPLAGEPRPEDSGRESEHERVMMSDIRKPPEVIDLRPKPEPEEPIEISFEPLRPSEEGERQAEPESEPEPVQEIIEEKPTEEKVEELEEAKPSFKFFTSKRIIAIFVVLALIGGGFALYFVLPKAQIIINPKKENIRFETEITADKNINSVDVNENSIPGQVFQLEMEDSRKFPTTGEKEVEEMAKGTITVYNRYSSDSQALVKTTRFLSEGGKIFRLTETTVIPGATVEEGEIIPSSKEVDVIADEAGESYNISPTNFTIPGFEGSPKYTEFYGESKDPMTGGAKGKMRVVTKDDIDGALEIVSLELEKEAQEEFSKKIPEGLKLLDNAQSLEVIESNSNLEADQPGKEFVITVKVRAWGLAFKEQDVFQLVEESVGDKISDNKTLLSSTIQVDYINADIDTEQGKGSFSCKIEADAAWKVNEETIRNDLAGKDEIEVRKYLSSLSEIETAKVVFWPFWVKKIPNNKDKIKIIIDTE